VSGLGRSIRKSCILVSLSRASYDYKHVDRNDEELREKIRELAYRRKRFGCPRIHLMLRRQGLVINHKRTERIYREEGLSLRKRKKRKTAAMARIIFPAAERPNERWSMDFVSDSIVTGRRFRALVVVDDYSRECPVIEVDTSLGGRRVVNVLEKLAEMRGLPEVITSDNGPEFTSKCRSLDLI
jgi:putative transposase